VLQLISGVAKLRVCGAENHAFRVWATAFSEQRKVSFKVGRIRNVMQVFNAVFPVASSMLIFSTMVSLKASAAEKGQAFEMSTGEFLAFSAAYGLFLAAMQALGDASLSMLKIVPIWERLRPILEATPEVDASKIYPGKLSGAIEISHLSFRYTADGPWILKDVSLKIQPGEFVALVGGSGSGKSTLMRLMLGFEHPEMGSIYYDGQDLATLDLRLVRSQMGVVLQESRLLPADIYRNIVGSSSRTVQEAWEAAEKAGIAEDVRAMPMQMHTVVSEGGGAFSGGQKQRLMIARAIVHKPKILFLDEATSALDNKTQAIVTESMNKLSATRIVIAHRLSTIVGADRICYLEQGELKEQGTFQELMDKDGLFAALAKRQLA
jgi:ATP-binding cassette subfamily C protein